MKFLGLRYKASEFLSTIKAKRGTRKCVVQGAFLLYFNAKDKCQGFLNSMPCPWQATKVPHLIMPLNANPTDSLIGLLK